MGRPKSDTNSISQQVCFPPFQSQHNASALPLHEIPETGKYGSEKHLDQITASHSTTGDSGRVGVFTWSIGDRVAHRSSMIVGPQYYTRRINWPQMHNLNCRSVVAETETEEATQVARLVLVVVMLKMGWIWGLGGMPARPWQNGWASTELQRFWIEVLT